MFFSQIQVFWDKKNEVLCEKIARQLGNYIFRFVPLLNPSFLKKLYKRENAQHQESNNIKLDFILQWANIRGLHDFCVKLCTSFMLTISDLRHRILDNIMTFLK